jgi:hypothetical protein
MLDPITVGLVRYQESPADPYNTIQFRLRSAPG